ncbi:hypothetical protein ACFXJ8_31295 [Nonomuraea sp. NPDC059194]|uniref:hypothetical protein n=1 Tax=Nonomuraea sp. NPDC059194 TaxID=3346764 RepID=UPI0036CD5C6B
MSSVPLPLLWLFGPSGVGKSSVGWEVFVQLSRSGVKTAFVDGDQISLCHPVPEGGTHWIRARSLAAMWPVFREEGAKCVVLSGVVGSLEEVREHTALLPDAALTLCRLRADPAELRERFLARGWRQDLVSRAVADARALDRGDFADVCVDTDGLTVADVARLVRERAGGWPHAVPAATSGGAVPGSPAPRRDVVPGSPAPRRDVVPGSPATSGGALPGSPPPRGGAVPGPSASRGGAAPGPSGPCVGAVPGPSVPRGDVVPSSSASRGDAVPVLWFSGATAVGKSTVGYEVFRQVFRTGVRAAYVDLKQLGALRPVADDDPGSHRLKARNLAALWAGYRAAGARCLIVSGDADADATLRGYAELLSGTAVTVCRLHAGTATLAERVARRGRGEGPVVPGDELKGLDADTLRRIAGRAAREAEALDLAGAGDLRIDTDGRSVREVVEEVQALIGDR